MDCVNCKKDILHCIVEGKTAVPGCVTGIARVVRDPDAVNLLNDGEILIMRMTDPESVPYMAKAAGVITDSGGILCHAAIVCREMKKPCIVGTKTAMRDIQSGMKITMCSKHSKILLEDK